MTGLFDNWVDPAAVCDFLARNHYLGPHGRGAAYSDRFGVVMVNAPTARHLPADWLELTRWCIVGGEANAGSRQWAGFARAVRLRFPHVTTIVSYSDPSVGHTGALYRACNWWWAPTWHRRRPPPTGNGAWRPGEQQAVKDRWVFALRADRRRVELLTARDEALLRAMPWARYREPGGADYRRFIAETRRAMAA